MNDKKLEFYNLLNGIKLEYLKIKDPFNILDSDIKITYKDIKLHYLKDKNYFVVVERDGPREKSPARKHDRNQGSQGNFQRSRSKSPRQSSPHQNNQLQHSPRQNSPNRVFTAEETAAYLERKKRREASAERSNMAADFQNTKNNFNKNNKHTRSKSPPYRRHHESRQNSPARVFTAEETAAYLERKKRRELAEKTKGGAGKPIYVYY